MRINRPLDDLIWRCPIPGKHLNLKDGVVVCGDALTLLQCLNTDSADIIFLDPPFNLGKRYGTKSAKDDNRHLDSYRRFITLILTEAARVLKPGGALYLYHIPKWALEFGAHLNSLLLFRHWIAISMKNGFVRGQRLYPAHYALLYFTKGEPAQFTRPKIPIQKCRHCKLPIRDYGGYKAFVAKGVNLSDIWDDLSPVRHKHKKTRQANELPPTLLERVMQISGHPHGIVVDPFAGSGASLVAALGSGMHFVANDREPSYYRLMVKRLTHGARIRKKGNDT